MIILLTLIQRDYIEGRRVLLLLLLYYYYYIINYTLLWLMQLVVSKNL